MKRLLRQIGNQILNVLLFAWYLYVSLAVRLIYRFISLRTPMHYFLFVLTLPVTIPIWITIWWEEFYTKPQNKGKP